MKIALYDPYGGKFTNDMANWWQEHGHEVRQDRYYDPEIAWWADVIWFDTCDNNLLSATNPGDALLADPELKQPWSLHDIDLTNKKVIVRPIDIEVWQGHFAYENMWDVVDHCIFIAPHIRDIMMADDRPKASKMKVHVIPHSINPDRWTFKEREPGFNIAVVSELWESKGTDIIPQIALKLKLIDSRFNINWVGRWSEYHWDREWFLDFIRHNKLPIYLTEWVDNLDEWLEDKNYLLHASKKEAFSAATAEAMAKGIKPILHRFYGADALWPGMTWTSIDEAVVAIAGNRISGATSYNSKSYLQYLVDHRYTTDLMMQDIMKVIES